MAPHSSTFAWKIPWTEEPGRLQSMGSLESDTTERLHFHFSLSCIGEGNGNPLQYSCLENPRDGEAWWAAIYGVVQSRTRMKRLSSSSSSSNLMLLQYFILNICIKLTHKENCNKFNIYLCLVCENLWVWQIYERHKEGWAPKNWCFQTVVDGENSWEFLELQGYQTSAEAEAPILWPPDAKSWITGKDPDAGKDWGQEEKGQQRMKWLDVTTKGQGSLVCCSSWSFKSWTQLSNWTRTTFLVLFLWWNSHITKSCP